MVFESIVVELINRYLGQFVENLDTSQLKIGIWGGDVVLNNLNLKESALDDLDLPVKIKAGHIGKLTLKIPWKNLYTEAVVAEIDGIYALAVPNIAIKYNEEKDKKAAQDAKQAKLQAIEDVKKAEAEKDKPADKKQDTFVEKLATQVIKNLQIRVSKIHVRYEDKYSNPLRPVALGVTLQELIFQTTDENWKEAVIKEAVTQIYKLIRLDSLSVYWNSMAELIQDWDKKDILASLGDNIAKPGHKPSLQYLFKPISAVAHLRLNTKPELTQFALPKMSLTLVFDEISLALSKDQYDDVLELLESMERMNLLSMYKKTRPEVEYHGNWKKWWLHAYAVVVEHTVRRRRLMWSWQHIQAHRATMRAYRELYTKKLEGKKLSSKEQESLKSYETDLDLFNIVMVRNQAEVNAQKQEAKRAEEKKEGGWFGGWFGGKKKKETASTSSSAEKDDLGNKFQEEFSSEEKAKLYKAIGYDESAVVTTLPVEYVAVRVVTKLNKLSVSLLDSRIRAKDNQLLKLTLSEISASFGQRPAASAIRLDAKVERLRATGSPRPDYVPKMINSIGVSKEENNALLSLAVETNPLDGECDSRIRVHTKPLEIIYDAITVNGMAKFFKPPESVRLKQFSDAAMAKYNVIKTQTATGMMHAMEDRKYADIEIHLMPSYIIVPQAGELQKNANMLLLSLGTLKMTSEKSKTDQVDLTKMTKEQVQDYAYDKFHISLENLQLLFVRPGDAWQDANRAQNSPMYLLRPVNINLLLEKCLFNKDPNLPQLRVGGELPLVSVAVSDSKLLGVMGLVQSIPLPEPAPEHHADDLLEQKVHSTLDVTADRDLHKVALRAPRKKAVETTSEYVNLTAMSLSFVVKEVSLEIMESKEEMEVPFLKLIVTRIGANMKMRTFDMAVDAYLGGIYLQHLQYKVTDGIKNQLLKFEVITGELINIINTPLEEEDEPLLSINLLQADTKGPEFHTTYNSTAQSLTVQFSTLDLVLHQGVILSLLEFAEKLKPPPAPATALAPSRSRKLSTASAISTSLSVKDIHRTSRPDPKKKDIVALNIRGLIDSIRLGICNETSVIMHSMVEGIECGVKMCPGKMNVSAVMRKVELSDPDPHTLHPQILSVSGADMLKLELALYDKATEGKNFDNVNNFDIDVALSMGRTRVVFVNKFIVSLMSFLDNFAVAKAKLDEAGKAMKEASKEMAKNLQEKAPRIKLQIMLKGPIIVVPQHSKSLETLQLQLGDLKVSNGFKQLQSSQIPQPGNALITEDMTVELTNLKMSRCLVLPYKNEGVQSEISILDPMTFKVMVKRNLSTGWNHDIPDVEVTAVLETIVVRLSQEDATMALHLLEENLKEGSPNVPVPDTPPAVVLEPSVAAGTETTPVPTDSAVVPKVILEPVEEDKNYSKMKLHFQLVSVLVQLFKGSSNLSHGQQVRSPEKMLTELCLRMLDVKLDMMASTAMSACVILEDFTMDDSRAEKKDGITKVISRTEKKALVNGGSSSSGQEDCHQVVNLTFEQNNTEDKIVVLHICSLHICVCVEFLMRVAEFFTNAMPKPKPMTVQQATAEQAARSRSASKVKPPEKKPEPVKGSLDVTLKLDKPEIYLIEDQLDVHTNSLIVDVGVNFRLRMSPDTLSINGSVNGLSLVSCIFGKPDTRQNVLSPCDISLIGSAPHNKDHHIDVSMTDFIINISPSTIRLLTAIASGLSVTPTEAVVETKLEDFTSVWQRKELADCTFWFTHLVVDSGSPVDSMAALDGGATGQEGAVSRGEQLMLSAPLLIIKLEGGVGHRTVPLLIVEAAFSGQVHDWSTQLFLESSLSVEVAYFNEALCVWEPILEPVIDSTQAEPRRWELAVEVAKGEEGVDVSEDSTVLPPPKMSINVVASDPLQLLVTKTCLDVLNNLGQAFNRAYQLEEMEGSMGARIIPYVFRNSIGEDMNLLLDSTFVPVDATGTSASVDGHTLKNGAEILMNDRSAKAAISRQVSVIKATQTLEEKRIAFSMLNDSVKHDMSIKQASHRIFSVGKTSASGEKFKVVCNVEAIIGQKIITFSSLLQIQNHLDTPMEILYREADRHEVCGTVDPGQLFPVPLAAVYCSTGEIFFRPKLEGTDLSTSKEFVKWKSPGEANKVKQISCASSGPDQLTYFFNAMPSFKAVYLENTEELTGQVITFHLHPTVILHNLLPFGIQYMLEKMPEMVDLGSGHNVSLGNASVNHTTMELLIPEYRGFQWTGRKMIKLDVPELSVWTFQADDNGKAIYMDLGIHSKEMMGSYDLSLYCPYWIVNMSDQVLALKEDDKEAPHVCQPQQDSIMLFYFRDKAIFGGSKRKVHLKVGDGEWSDKFSLDTVGSSGNVSCKHKTEGYTLEVGVKIHLSASGLTKIVTFTPFYMLLNASSVSICVQEEASDLWTCVKPGACLPYYPKTAMSKDKEVKVKAKVENDSETTAMFFLNKAHTSLLKLDNKFGGINADCQVRESAMITTFKLYRHGMATVQLVNHTTQCSISIKQSGTPWEALILDPQTSQMYTWDNPSGNREMTWSCGKKKDAKNKLDQDSIEEFFADDDVKVYFVSFLDGMQRVIMFTEDLALATVAQAAGELEQADQEINLKVHDMGLSLINNHKMVEVAYMGITSSGVIWEEKKKRFKAMKLKDCTNLEHAYQKFLMETAAGKRKDSLALLENKIEVDFEKMEMVKPRKCTIRRSFEDGIWVQFKSSPHSTQFHAKFNRLQFDNQLRHAVFPTILSPLPPPKSVAADSVPKPFMEVSLMMRIHEHSQLMQIKYFKVLIQEMNLKVDQGFLNAILDLLASGKEHSRDQEVVDFEKDVAYSKRDLKQEAGVSIQAQKVSFYDYFHISPIKVHLSFSLQGGEAGAADSPAAVQANVMNVFLQSVGVVLTDIQDVVFKLGYFERNNAFYNQSQLTSEFVRHYSGQAVKQMYVLVLGLDVLGNPFGLLRGLSEGIEDLFYEPYQGAIQGPEEFAEGLALGVRSLFGHAVGGAAGAVSRITGTLGKGLAALTLDDDYQKKRREQLNKRPATAREGFARGGKGLVMGVFDGVTGIVRKPVEGAKQDGVAGFFKGMGKGLVGVVTRPTSGVVDFASSSLEGIRRITDMNEEIRRLRPPRKLNRDGIIRPYVREEAEGYNLLLETEKGKYVESDEYLAHANVKEDGKIVFIITDQRVMLAKRGEIFGSWETDWMVPYQDMKGPPKVIAKGIEILLKEKEKKKLFGNSSVKKDVPLADPRVAPVLVEKMKAAMEALNIEIKS